MKGEVIYRLEPKFYTKIFRDNEARIMSSKYPILKLRDVTLKISDGTHFTPEYQQAGVKFLSVKDVRPFKINYHVHKFLLKNDAEILDKRCKPTIGDILLTKVGTIGNAAQIKQSEPFQIFVSLALLRPNTDKITSDYLEVYLNTSLAYLQYKRIIKGAGVPDLHLEDINRILIPLPNSVIQEKITIAFNNIYNKKIRKEEEAKNILLNIDDYLLRELNIKLPKTDKKKTYITFKENIVGSRLDPTYHQNHFIEIIKSIKGSSFKWGYLKDIINGKLIKGYLPNEKEKEGDKKVVQINSINMDGSIDLSNVLTAKDVFEKHHMLQLNDILIVITGATIGKISIWENPGEYFLGSDILKFQVKEGINPYYIFALLRCNPLQLLIKRNITGATNGHLSSYDVRHLIIPIPDISNKKQIEKQNIIANEILNIRIEAKKLQQKAIVEFNNAKEEVEKMILA